jgi:putative transposase
MVRSHCLARAISDAAWGDLRTMLEYKCDWYGRDLVVIDRWYPSSKLCSGCGALRDPHAHSRVGMRVRHRATVT